MAFFTVLLGKETQINLQTLILLSRDPGDPPLLQPSCLMADLL